jgi:hypothetical protein
LKCELHHSYKPEGSALSATPASVTLCLRSHLSASMRTFPHRRARGTRRKPELCTAVRPTCEWQFGSTRPHVPASYVSFYRLRTCRRMRSGLRCANCDQGASQQTTQLFDELGGDGLSSCCRCAARRARDSCNAIYGMSAHWQRAYSGLILAARITLPHFSVSSAMSLPKSAGESASGTLPRSARRALIL